MVDSIDPRKLSADLDLALNPPSNSPSSAGGFSWVPLNTRPTEIFPLSPDMVEPIVSTTEKLGNTRQEDYKTDSRIISHVLHLIRNGNKKLGSLKFDLEYVHSEDHVRRILKNSLALGHINEAEYEKLVGYLGEVKPTEVVLNEEKFVVPEELIFYVKSLVQNGIGPTMLLVALMEENISKDYVLETLNDSFHHLKILSADQYTKTLQIMGEPEEEIARNLLSDPNWMGPPLPQNEARAKRDDVTKFKDEIVKVEAPIIPTPEPVVTPINIPNTNPSVPEQLDVVGVPTEADSTLEVRSFFDTINLSALSDEALIDSVINEYSKIVNPWEAFLRDLNNIRDDKIHRKVLDIFIQRALGHNRFEDALELAGYIRDEGSKERVKTFVQDMKVAASPTGGVGLPTVIPEPVVVPVVPPASPTPVVSPVIPPTPPPPPVVSLASVLTPEQVAEEINIQLESVRGGYATELLAWNNEVRSKHKGWKKMMSDLGVTRPIPEIAKPQALIDAENAYMEAKKKRVLNIAGPAVTNEEKLKYDPESTMTDVQLRATVVKFRILEQAEKERGNLENKKSELSPAENEKLKKLKETVAKASVVWTKVPLAVRLSVAPILIGSGVAFTGGLLVGGIYAGKKLVRGVGGAFGARGIGSWRDSKDNEINENLRKKAEVAYLDDSNGTFEEREKKYQEFLDAEVKRIKAQKIKKAMLMVGIGAGTGILSGLAEASLSHGVTSSTSSSGGILDSLKSKIGIDQKVPDLPPSPFANSIDSLTPKISEIPKINPISVELSPKGFIQDIHNLKAKIIHQYGDIDKVPPSLKENFIDKPSTSLAEQFGFSYVEKGLSGRGLKGEFLGVDSRGNIVYEHAGKTDVMFNAETAEITKFEQVGGKMFSPKTVSEVPQEATLGLEDNTSANFRAGAEFGDKPEISFEDQVGRNMRDVNFARPADASLEAPVPLPEPTNSAEIPKLSPDVKLETLPITYKGSVVEIVNEGNGRIIKIGEEIIAHEQAFGTGKILALDDKFQDGSRYQDIRGAFAESFEKNTLADQIGETPTAVPFEGGKIYIIQGLKDNPDGVSVLLNGKEIAKSVVNTGVSKSIDIEYLPNIPHHSGPLSWLLSDNVYERAFKAAKKVIKTLSTNASELKK